MSTGLAAAAAVALSLASSLPLARGASTACGADSKCPKDSPCCSAEGTCGRGSMQCAGGCQPLFSYSPSSCLPNPVCQSQSMAIKSSDYNNTDLFTPILDYNGDPTLSPFTLDSGSLGAGPEGVLLEMTIERQAKISTTRYFLYGTVTATLRHQARQGLVATMITMSDIKDEIDWEFTTANSGETLTNYFKMGNAVTTQGATIYPDGGFDVADWHEYGLDWQEDRLRWTIDGQTVRTVTRQQAGDAYPRSPSRVQFSIWAGGNSTNAPGTIDWAGGPISYDTDEYRKNGVYSQEIKSFSISCNPSTNGGSTNATSWVYTGSQSDSTNEPEYTISTSPIKPLSEPSRDGYAGYPGYDSKPSAGTGPGTNRWDGSGTTSKAKPGSSDSSGDDGVTTQNALKYGLPIAGALVALIAVWALVTVVYRRRHKDKLYASGVTGIAGGPGMVDKLASSRGRAASATGLFAVTSATGAGVGRKGSKYIPLQDVADAGLPDGTTRIGTGIAPASGPTPARSLMYRGYSDDGSSKMEAGGGYEDAAWKSTDSFQDDAVRGAYGAWPDRPAPYQQQQQQPTAPHQYTPPRYYNQAPAAAPPPPPPQQQQQQQRGWTPAAAQQRGPYTSTSPQPRHYDTPNVGYYATPQIQQRAQYHGQPTYHHHHHPAPQQPYPGYP
ncbi:uncharacterized protein PFL1_02853 [Pseudozyma flocculosa PF-1]|uniref:GH16 domain-containing protein n=2 Tax=Pseudozyma flocculosa TaxID=84751 RepID=A0A5C3F4Q3_9BASI|nr:uncharacterized protein PFL1_02853 [Pseudozyma flocculosa PF-1]EPQ29634.1 hypothetical protein PFL1_02853 [Pseudozyma flocculosa PF-1]SPO38201.1 uncharacterized protein PSFLO_03678 [Pseudozyma flocculosa]